MPRWQQGSKERLQAAAIDLFAAQGFENTSVAEIAERAGVTNRTFFRHFADKREVLFSESDTVRDALIAQIMQAPRKAKPFDIITGIMADFDWETLGPRDFQRQRQAIIAANPELLERDLIKVNKITLALIDAFEQRGADATSARLATRVGVQLFTTAYHIWLEDGGDMAAISKKLKALLTKIVS
jgi:AcrR family transcriptional regulator